jgi:hypothetical protein
MKVWKDKEVVVVKGTILTSSMFIENPKEHSGLEVNTRPFKSIFLKWENYG